MICALRPRSCDWSGSLQTAIGQLRNEREAHYSQAALGNSDPDGEPSNPAHRRAVMPTEQAVTTPHEELIERLDV